MTERLSLGQCVTLACLWEATAAKPGNVHRGADFENLTFADFVTGAAALGPVFERVHHQSLGEVILRAVGAMAASVNTNTHLGTILLLAPLALGHRAGGDLWEAADQLVRRSTLADAQHAYQAIRVAAPGGLGEVDQADVREAPQLTLYEAMRLAAGRDLIAQQYVTGFADVRSLADQLARLLRDGRRLSDAIVHAHVWQMARQPDTLIARKCGPPVAAESAARAQRILAAGQQEYQGALSDLDFWLRADGHRRNPGTTADLIAAALFALLVEERIDWPVSFYQPH